MVGLGEVLRLTLGVPVRDLLGSFDSDNEFDFEGAVEVEIVRLNVNGIELDGDDAENFDCDEVATTDSVNDMERLLLCVLVKVLDVVIVTSVVWESVCSLVPEILVLLDIETETSADCVRDAESLPVNEKLTSTVVVRE